MRIVTNILAGNGPVFNVGERVETYTSTLWLAIITVLAASGVRLEYVAMFASILLSLLGLILALGAATNVATLLTGEQQKTSPLNQLTTQKMVPLGIIIYAAFPVAWDFATSGLETGLSLTWLGLSYFLLTRQIQKTEHPHPEPNLSLVTAAILGLGPLVRPDLALYSAGFLTLLLFIAHTQRTLTLKNFLKVALSAAVLPVAYQIFRMGYFAAIVPNTALAKSAFHSNWTQGWSYLHYFLYIYFPHISLPAATFFLLAIFKKAKASRNIVLIATLITPVIIGILHIVYIVKVGGDFMFGRLLLPPIFAIILPVAAIPWNPNALNIEPRKHALFFAGIICLVACYNVMFAKTYTFNETYDPDAPYNLVNNIADEHHYYHLIPGPDHRVTLDDYNYIMISETQPIYDQAATLCPNLIDADNPTCQTTVHRDEPFRNAELIEPAYEHYELQPKFISRGYAASHLLSAIGMRSLMLGPRFHITDNLGLADPIASRITFKKRTRPGHERHLSSYWYLARTAKEIIPEDPRVAAARRALECPPLADLQNALENPLTPTLFLNNIRQAHTFHKLIIPSDPFTAQQLLCTSSAS